MKKKLQNPGQIQFTGTIIDAGGGGAYVEFPFDTHELFGTNGRVPILANIDGEPYRGTMVRMGTIRHILIILKEIREKIQKGFGDEVQVTIKLDEEPRQVEVPQDVQLGLAKNALAKEAFERLSYSHQREYVMWIESAKKEETRQRRIQKLLDDLNQ